MKRILVLFLAIVMIFSICACGKSEGKNTGSKTDTGSDVVQKDNSAIIISGIKKLDNQSEEDLSGISVKFNTGNNDGDYYNETRVAEITISRDQFLKEHSSEKGFLESVRAAVTVTVKKDGNDLVTYDKEKLIGESNEEATFESLFSKGYNDSVEEIKATISFGKYEGSENFSHKKREKEDHELEYIGNIPDTEQKVFEVLSDGEYTLEISDSSKAKTYKFVLDTKEPEIKVKYDKDKKTATLIITEQNFNEHVSDAYGVKVSSNNSDTTNILDEIVSQISVLLKKNEDGPYSVEIKLESLPEDIKITCTDLAGNPGTADVLKEGGTNSGEDADTKKGTGNTESGTDKSSQKSDESWIESHSKTIIIALGVFIVLLLLFIIRLLRGRNKRQAPGRRSVPVQKTANDLPSTAPMPQGRQASAPRSAPRAQLYDIEKTATADDFATTMNVTTAPAVSGSLTVKVAKTHHIGKRNNQEDSFGISHLDDATLCRTKGVMAVVADGMGGLKHGEDVSSISVLSMLDGFSDIHHQQTGEKELNRLLQATVNRANAYLEQNGCLKKSGSTLMSVIVFNDALSWVSVGDSRISLFRNGHLSDLNHKHNYGAELDEMVSQNKISVQQALNNPDRDKLTSYIGMGQLKHVDMSVQPMQLMRNDKVILMSDGIFNTLSDAEIEQVLRLPIEAIGDRLEAAVLAKNNPHQDNFTAVILELS